MKKITIIFIVLILAGCKSSSQSKSSVLKLDFQAWHSAVLETFETKTGFKKGEKKEHGTSLGVVDSAIKNFSEQQMEELLVRSNADKSKWDKLFILDFYIEGETSYFVTSILLYNKAKYKGVSFDGSRFYDLKYIPKFKVWKINSEHEFGNNGYIVISEFDKQYKNISNKILIGIPNYEVNEKLVKIYDSAIFD
ncbi:MAG: hypothetical protein KIS77_11245 [Saprospiraceae bacterium]|nr:hypothetical protein [Saprospiraceae bacterium]